MSFLDNLKALIDVSRNTMLIALFGKAEQNNTYNIALPPMDEAALVRVLQALPNAQLALPQTTTEPHDHASQDIHTP